MKIELLKMPELKSYCETLSIDIKKKKKKDLIQAVYDYQRKEIDDAIEDGSCLDLLKSKIQYLADEYTTNLDSKITARKAEMKKDDNSHYLIYRDSGRFLYKYAGSFLEEAASLCIFFSNSNGGKTIVENTEGKKPKTFEIDFLNGNDAVELKWRDAITDGDHITKEHTRVKVIKSHGYNPVRVMFYYPQREQSIKIQETLKTLYKGVKGEYYAGDDAWDYLTKISGYDLKAILTEIADNRELSK